MEAGSRAALHLGIDTTRRLLEVRGAPQSRGVAPRDVSSITGQLARCTIARGRAALEGGSRIAPLRAQAAGGGGACI